jgi:hypothetical protein
MDYSISGEDLFADHSRFIYPVVNYFEPPRDLDFSSTRADPSETYRGVSRTLVGVY